jgi:flagellar assembly protein FliH
MSELLPVRIVDARPESGFRPYWATQPRQATNPELIEEAGDDPYEKGYRQGQADAEQAFSDERQRIVALLAACEAFQPEPSEELALLIAETVDGLVRLTVGEVEIDAALLLERARRAAALVAVADSDRRLHLNPDDLALLDAGALPLSAVPDPGLSRGSLRIEDSAGWVEDGVSIHLDALREQLGLGEPAQ